MKLVYNDLKHTYTLDGVRAKSVTAVAKIPTDTFTIEQWGKRMVAIGMTLDPNLIENVAVDLDNKDAIQTVCEKAQETAKAHLKADRGTQMHRASEFVDLERTDLLLTDQQKRDAEAWRRTIEAYEITMLPGFIEGFVAYPQQRVVGRFDRVARIGVCNTTAVIDLKSGENAVLYPQSTAVQLALYCNAPHVSAAIKTVGDRSEVTEWTTMPDDIDRANGYVVLLRPDADVGELWRLDIAHGQAGAAYALELVEWRKAHDYGKALSSQVQLKIAAPAATEPLVTNARAVTADVRVADKAGVVSPAEVSTDRRGRLLAQFNLLNEHDQAKFRGLMLDPNDLDLIEMHLNSIDVFQTVHVPMPPRPETKPPVQIVPKSKVTPIPEPSMGEMEGKAVVGDVWSVTARAFETVDEAGKTWIKDIVAEAHDAQVWMSGVGNRTTRRHRLLKGLVTLALADQDDDGLLRLIVSTVLDSDTPQMDSFPLGQIVGSLDADEAVRFDELCTAFIAGELQASVSDDGSMRLIPAA